MRSVAWLVLAACAWAGSLRGQAPGVAPLVIGRVQAPVARLHAPEGQEVADVLVVTGSLIKGEMTLRPVYSIRARPSPPSGVGPHRLTGTDDQGRTQFEYDFSLPSLPDLEDGSAFFFMIAIDEEWESRLQYIVWSGPAGRVTIGPESPPVTVIPE